MAGEPTTTTPFEEAALTFDGWFPPAPPTAKPAPPPSPEDILLDFDSWHARQPPGIKSRIDTHLKAAGPGAAKEKERLGATAMVAAESGADLHTVGKDWPMAWRGYAEKRWGTYAEASMDEGAFIRHLKEDVTHRKEVRAQAVSFGDAGAASALALVQPDPMKDLLKIHTAAQAIEGMEPADRKALTDTYFRARNAVNAAAGPYRPVARRIASMLATEVVSDPEGIREKVLDEMMGVPPEAREHVIRMIATQQIGDFTTTEDKFFASEVRGLATQMRGAGSDIERARLLRLQDTLQDGGGGMKDGETVEDAYKRLAGFAAKGGDSVFARAPGASLFDRDLTPAERGELKTLAKKGLERNILAGQIATLVEQTIDPVRARNHWERIATNVGTSLGMMAPMMVPYFGTAISQAGYADQEFQRQVSMGTDPAVAHQMAQITGTVQAGVERMSHLFSFGRGTGGLMGGLRTASRFDPERLALMRPGAALAARLGNRVSVIQGAEYTEEIVQDAAPALTAWVAEGAGMTLPQQASFKQESENWKLWNPETFLTVAALSLAGGGFQGVSESAAAQETLARSMADPISLQALGVPQAEAERISQLPEDQRRSALRTAFPTRDITTPEAVAARVEIAERDRNERVKARRQAADLEAAGLTITRVEDGFRVTDTASGDAAHYETPEEAVAAARSIVVDRGIQKSDKFMDALGDYAATMREGRTIEIDSTKQTLLDALEEASAEGNTGTVADVWARAQQFREANSKTKLVEERFNPLSRQALAGMQILGRSVTEAQGNAARSVSRIMDGGNVSDLIEEQAESDLKEAIFYDPDMERQMAGALKNMEDATGLTFIHNGNIVEGWSAMVRLIATGTRAGNKITGGIRSETAAKIWHARRKLQEAKLDGVEPELMAKAEEYLAQTKAIMGTVAKVMKAKGAGTLAKQDDMIREAVGLKPQDSYDTGVAREAGKLYRGGDTFALRDDSEGLSIPDDTGIPQATGGPEAGPGELQDGGRVRGGVERLEAPRDAPPPGTPLRGLPGPVDVPGVGRVAFGPFAPAQRVAQEYVEGTGRVYDPPRTYAKVDKARATRIAQAYQEMVHAPNDPAVAASYRAMIDETLAQWEAIKTTGLKVEPIMAGMADPYEATPRLAVLDVTENNHLWFFPTDNGFGGSASADVDISGNPMMEFTGEVLGGLKMRANDVFRIVHDYFGHVKEGVGFRADGEENAWRSHSSMYSDLARPAMTSETRGQNSWVNFGPFAEFNKTAAAGETQYAPQKNGIMPEWTMIEGAGDPVAGGTSFSVREQASYDDLQMEGAAPQGEYSINGTPVGSIEHARDNIRMTAAFMTQDYLRSQPTGRLRSSPLPRNAEGDVVNSDEATTWEFTDRTGVVRTFDSRRAATEALRDAYLEAQRELFPISADGLAITGPDGAIWREAIEDDVDSKRISEAGFKEQEGVADVLMGHARFGEFFQYGKTTSPDAADIAAAVSEPGRTITGRQGATSVVFMGRNGYLTIQEANTDRPYISSAGAGSQGQQGGGGSQLYAAAFDWIHNNNKRVRDDPGGLTDINSRRRTSNMLASALRWGTTEHLSPHRDQKIPRWAMNNDKLNIAALALQEAQLLRWIPQTAGWKFNFHEGTFENGKGEALTSGDFEQAVQSGQPGKSGIGISTIQRGLLASSALSEIRRGESAESLVAEELPRSLTRVSYSVKGVDPEALSVKAPEGVKAVQTDALPVWVIEKTKESLPKHLNTPATREKFFKRLDAALVDLRKDPASIATADGWVRFLKAAGISGEIPMPPSGLLEVVTNPAGYVAKLEGGYHGERTLAGTQESAKEGLDGTRDMRRIIGEGKAPSKISVALHHMWGILSRMLAPLQQEGMWLRLIAHKPVLDAIQSSIDGTFDLNLKEWEAMVQAARAATAEQAGSIGNSATANANSFYAMLERLNGRWQDVADIYAEPNSQAMGRKFWALDAGKLGIKNKVQRFIGLTFGVPGVIMDRWKFVEFWLPTAMESKAATEPSKYFDYGQNTPEDPMGIYGVYGGVDSGNEALSLAMYEGFEAVLEEAIKRSPELQAHLGENANAGGMHWHGWNAIKNEAVGHSSLDLTKDIETQFGAGATADDVHKLIQSGSYYTEGAENQRNRVKFILERGGIRTERTSTGLASGQRGGQLGSDGRGAERGGGSGKSAGDGTAGGKGGTSFSIAPAEGLENLAFTLHHMAKGAPDKNKMFSRAYEQLAGMARAVEGNDKTAAAISANADAAMTQRHAAVLQSTQAKHATEVTDMEAKHAAAEDAMETVHEDALFDLQAEHDLDMGAAKNDGWTADQRDALTVRQRGERDRLTAKQRAESTALDVAQRAEAARLGRRHRSEVKDLKEAQEKAVAKRAAVTGDEAERRDMMRFMQALDAVLAPFPAEVRGKVGGFTKLAGLTTNESMEKHIRKRIGKLDTEIERYLKAEYREQLEDLLDKAKAKVGESRVAKGKLTPETQAIIDKARTYSELTPKEVESGLVRAEGAIAAATNDDELKAAVDEYLMLDMVGGVLDETPKWRTAGDLAAAIKYLTEIYKEGRTGFAVLAEANKAKWDANRAAIISKVGPATSDQAEQRQREDRASGPMSALRSLDDLAQAGLFDIHQQLAALLGEKHPLVRQRSVEIRHAREKARIEMQEEQEALHDWIRVKLGIKSNARQSIMLSKLSRNVDSPVERTEGRKTTTDEISTGMAEQITTGTVDDPRYPPGSEQFKELEQAYNDYVASLAAWDAGPKKGRRPEKRFIEVERVTDPGVKKKRRMSELDAVQDTLLWQQERYQENMERHGMGKDYQAGVEAWLSPEAKSIREFLRERYAMGYPGMNATYRQLFNMDMPQEKNYARAVFNTAGNNVVPMGPNGLPAQQGGGSIGQIKGRVEHKAEPKQQNALVVRLAHVAQTAHWKHAAVVARDLRAEFSPIEVRNAITARHGATTYSRLMNALDTFESAGWKQAANNMDGHELISRIMNLGVANSLGFKLSSFAAQIPAMFNSAARIGPKAYGRALFQLATNPSLLAEIYRDPALQLRRGGPYSVGQMAAMLSGERGNIVAQNIMRAGEMGTEVLGIADAAWSVISGGAAYIAHLRDAKKAQAPIPASVTGQDRIDRQKRLDEEAKAIARDEMRETIEATSQPMDFTRKANFENQIASSRGVGAMAMRGMFMFKSAARQISAGIALTLRQAVAGDITKTQAAERLFVLTLLLPLLSQVMRSMVKDLSSDDPDDEIWRKKSTWIAAFLSSFTDGIPVVGSLTDIIKVQALGTHTVTAMDPASGIINEVVNQVGKMTRAKDPEMDSKSVQMAVHVAALGLAVAGLPGGELLEGLANAGATAAGIRKNLETTEAEKDQEAKDAKTVKDATKLKQSKKDARMDKAKAADPTLEGRLENRKEKAKDRKVRRSNAYLNAHAGEEIPE